MNEVSRASLLLHWVVYAYAAMLLFLFDVLPAFDVLCIRGKRGSGILMEPPAHALATDFSVSLC